MKNIFKRISTPLLLAALLGFVAGLLWLVSVRFITLKNNAVHYHANFALYINGQRDEFKFFTFYEEVQSCDSNAVDNPKTRVHLHDQNNHLVHVHDNGVTWGALFANLGYTLGNDLIKTNDGVFISGQDGKKLSFILNGKPVETIANEVIKSEDVLLISYGTEPHDVLDKRYDSIPRDAHTANQKVDPASCSGSKPLDFKQRLIKAIAIGN